MRSIAKKNKPLPAAALPACALAALAATTCCAPTDIVEVKPPLRVANLRRTTDDLQVTVDGIQTFRALAYGQTSPYIAVDPGQRELKVLVDNVPRRTVFPTLEPPFSYTALVAGDSGPPVVVVARDLALAPRMRIRLRVAHLAPDLPAVDVYLDRAGGAPVALDAGFGQISPYRLISAFSTQLVLTEPGERTPLASIDIGRLLDTNAYTVAVLPAADSTGIAALALDDSGVGDEPTIALVASKPPLPSALPLTSLGR